MDIHILSYTDVIEGYDNLKVQTGNVKQLIQRVLTWSGY